MNRPSSGPKLTVRERREAQIQETFTELVSEVMQLKRTLWLVLRTIGKQTDPQGEIFPVTVDQLDMSLLWNLKFTAVPESATKLMITSQMLPEATNEQMAALADLLVGTAKSIADVRAAAGLPDHPAGYLQARLLPIHFDAELKCWTRPSPPEVGTAPTHAAI